MIVKVSLDEGATFEEPCDLRKCFPDDDEEYEIAHAELTRANRYWSGGGAAALAYIVRLP